MNNLCNIVRDLLPLYAEGMASSDTVSFVEGHLAGCPACREVLDDMNTPTDGEKAACDLSEEDLLPLKVFQRKWKRKKVFLVCSTILLTTVFVCCALFAADRLLYQEKITVNNGIYTNTNNVIVDLPDGSVEIGYLRGISRRSTADPMGNFMATNLDQTYGGCSIYQSRADEQTIYLQDHSGFYLVFMLSGQVPQAETASQ